MKFPTRVAAAAFAAVALTPASAHAQQQYTVGFGWEPKTPTTLDDVALSATTTAPDVSWDFDGDGAADASGKQVVHRFATAGDHRVAVLAKWPGAVPIERRAVESIHVDAGTATPTATPTVTPVATASPQPTATPEPCRTTVTAGLLKAMSACFETTGSRHASRFPVTLNGIRVEPLAGKPVTIDLTGKPTISSDNARVIVSSNGLPMTAYTGKLSWTLEGDKLSGFAFAAPNLGGMKITGMPAKPQLLANGQTRLKLYLALPSKLGGATSASPVNVDTNASAGFMFKIATASLPGLSMSHLTVKHNGQSSWSIDAQVKLPNPVPLKVTGGLAVKAGSFQSLHANRSFGAGGPHYGPITLKKLSFAVELNPKVSKCVPKIGKETVDMAKLYKQVTGSTFNAKPVVIDHGKPTLAMCGDIGLSAGPSLLGAPALSLDGGFGLKVFNDRPGVLRAYGKVKLLGMTLSDAELEVRGNGYIGLRSKYEWGWKGVAALRGYTAIEFLGSKFNGEGYNAACLDFIDYCIASRGLLSTKGIAVCLNIDTWLGDWHPGFGAKWGHSPKLYWSGCDLGPYREKLTASAASAGHAVRLPRGLPGAVIAVHGRGGAPKVAFVGPKGERIVTPADLKPVGARGSFLMQVPGENVTQVAIAKPSAGEWRIEALPGSVPIARVATAEGLERPSVKASVKGGKLRYRVVTRPGQVVRFVERGPSAGGELGVARGARGTLRFTPAAGRAERREIVALVEQDGALRDRIVVASYRAPGPARPAAVRGLKVRRAGSSLVASWRGARSAEVRASLPDGRRLVLRPSGTRVRIPNAKRGTVTVRALSPQGLPGRAVSARVK